MPVLALGTTILISQWALSSLLLPLWEGKKWPSPTGYRRKAGWFWIVSIVKAQTTFSRKAGTNMARKQEKASRGTSSYLWTGPGSPPTPRVSDPKYKHLQALLASSPHRDPPPTPVSQSLQTLPPTLGVYSPWREHPDSRYKYPPEAEVEDFQLPQS